MQSVCVYCRAHEMQRNALHFIHAHEVYNRHKRCAFHTCTRALQHTQMLYNARVSIAELVCMYEMHSVCVYCRARVSV